MDYLVDSRPERYVVEEGGGSPTMTGLLGSGLLFFQQNIVGGCSPNSPKDCGITWFL